MLTWVHALMISTSFIALSRSPGRKPCTRYAVMILIESVHGRHIDIEYDLTWLIFCSLTTYFLPLALDLTSQASPKDPAPSLDTFSNLAAGFAAQADPAEGGRSPTSPLPLPLPLPLLWRDCCGSWGGC